MTEFKSQICTTVEQSKRLLGLGLKKETADMGWGTITLNGEPITFSTEDSWDDVEITEIHIPAWSLHRLIEMMPRYVQRGNIHYERTLFPESVCYYKELYKDCGDNLISFDSPNLYARLIHCIEWLIEDNLFNKEYLV